MPGRIDPWLDERIIGDMRPGDHACLHYRSDAEKERLIGAFVRDGLHTLDKVIYVVRDEHEHVPGIGPPNGIDPRPFLMSGHLAILTAPSICLTKHEFDPDRLIENLSAEIAAALKDGYRGVRLTADMSWVLEAGWYPRLAEAERQVDAAVGPSTTMIAICQLDARRCPPDSLRRIHDAHEVLAISDPLFSDNVLTISQTFEPTGLRLTGELDAARHAVFAEALYALPLNGHDIHVDMSGLRFVDLGSLTTLSQLGQRLDGQARLILDNLPQPAVALIELVGRDMFDGVTLTTEVIR